MDKRRSGQADKQLDNRTEDLWRGQRNSTLIYFYNHRGVEWIRIGNGMGMDMVVLGHGHD